MISESEEGSAITVVTLIDDVLRGTTCMISILKQPRRLNTQSLQWLRLLLEVYAVDVNFTLISRSKLLVRQSLGKEKVKKKTKWSTKLNVNDLPGPKDEIIKSFSFMESHMHKHNRF